MNFLANENFPMPSVRRLREAGHDVAAIASEERVLERAVAEGRVILTFDRDYGRLIFDFAIPGNFIVVERDRLRRRTLPPAP